MNKTIFLSILLIPLFISCSSKQKKEEIKSIFPKQIAEYKMVSAEEVLDKKSLKIEKEMNINKKLKGVDKAKYQGKNDIEIRLYKYDSDLTAFSEYSQTKDTDYFFSDNSLTYRAGDRTVTLDNSKIWVMIYPTKENPFSILNIKAKTSIKIPAPSVFSKNELAIETIPNSERVILQEADYFPFFSPVLQRDYIYKDVRFSAYEPYNNQKIDSKMDKFIKEQKIVDSGKNKWDDSYIFFQLKDDEGASFIWRPQQNRIIFQFEEDDIETLLSF
ncbi:hypothetical protein JXR93_08230 [bacterium]|nr:hypothetical protein [bacterium]